MIPYEFTCRDVSEATSYMFRDPARSTWASCTVNETTGELVVVSDHGNWSHRWGIQYTGHAWFAEFLAARDPGHVEYLVQKLTTHAERRVFDAWDTVVKWKRGVRQARHAEHLSQATAREFYDQLDDLKNEDDPDKFLEGVFAIEGYQRDMDADPWEDLVYRPSASVVVLEKFILPALVTHLKLVVRQRRQAAEMIATLVESLASLLC